MTDAQLSILLGNYSVRLRQLIDDVEAALPDEAKEEVVYNSLFPSASYTKMECRALDALRDFASEIDQDADMLERIAKNQTQTGSSRG